MLKARTEGRGAHLSWALGNAPAQSLERPCAARRGAAAVGASGRDTPVEDEGLMERVGERGHRLAALRRVQQNGCRPGSDGRTVEAGLEATGAGMPPGGPVSPVRAHLLRDGLEKAWESGGHRVVRYAEDGTIDVQRVLARGTRFLEPRLTRRGHAANRAGDRPGRRTVLGGTCTGQRPNRRRVRETALRACKPEGRRRYRELRRRGISRELGWKTVRSAQGPWRLRRRPARPALASARPGRSCGALGLPRLQRGSHC